MMVLGSDMVQELVCRCLFEVLTNIIIAGFLYKPKMLTILHSQKISHLLNKRRIGIALKYRNGKICETAESDFSSKPFLVLGSHSLMLFRGFAN